MSDIGALASQVTIAQVDSLSSPCPQSCQTPAKALVDGVTVIRKPIRKASYWHLLLDEHDMVFSEGIATESLFTGAVAMDVLAQQAQNELHEIFPDFRQSDPDFS